MKWTVKRYQGTGVDARMLGSTDYPSRRKAAESFQGERSIVIRDQENRTYSVFLKG